jgi:hypothetical protein
MSASYLDVTVTAEAKIYVIDECVKSLLELAQLLEFLQVKILSR